MKVFFTTTPRLKKDFPKVIKSVYESIEELGHSNLYDYLRDVKVDEFYKFNSEKAPVYYEEILEAIRKSDVVVFEASMHSIGVGMLIKEAMEQGKGVVVLHMKDNFPFFLGGIKNERFVISEYKEENVKTVLESSLDYISGKMDVRFNFFISPEIGTYLDWIAKNRRIPRAVYLRRLIEKDMKENKEYREE